MKKKKIFAIIMTLLLAVFMCVPAFAEDMDSAGNVFESGDTVSLPTIPFFGGFIAGQNVNVSEAEASGSVMAAGQEVNVGTSSIGESLYVAGNNVSVSGTQINGNVWAAGNNISIGEGTSANGVYAAGSNIVFGGTSNGFFAAGNKIVISGTVNGDVSVEGEDIEIMDSAVISGKLSVKSTDDPDIADGAQIGEYSHDEIADDIEDVAEGAATAGIFSVFLKKVTSCLYWVAAMAAFGMLLVWLFNDDLDRALAMIKEKPGPMIGAGIVSWICIPIVIITLCCAYLLAPIAGMLTLAYVLVLCAGLAFAGASLARFVFPNMNPFLSALIGIAVLEVLRMIPVVGFIIGIAADMYLLGYVVINRWSHRLQKKSEEAAGGVTTL